MFGAGNGSIWKGILIGVGVSAVGFYAYKKNEDKVDAFLRRETIEDLIAEKEMQEQSVTVEAPTEA